MRWLKESIAYGRVQRPCPPTSLPLEPPDHAPPPEGAVAGNVGLGVGVGGIDVVVGALPALVVLEPVDPVALVLVRMLAGADPPAGAEPLECREEDGA